MINTEYLEDLADRAAALNISDGWVDSDKLLYLKKGKLLLNLDNYVEIAEDEVIDIPDIFYGVLIDVLSDKYDEDKAYRFIFPKNLYYFGHLSNIRSNVIDIRKHDGIEANTLSISFQNSTFDFSKCVRLNTVKYYSFTNLVVKEILFGNGIYKLDAYSFCNANIQKLSFTNLRVVCSRAFLDASFDDVDFGLSLVSAFSDSLVFDTPVNEVIMGGIDNISHKSFQNIRSIYLPYNTVEYLYDLSDKLDTIQRDIKDNKYNTFKLMRELTNLVDEFKQDNATRIDYIEICDLIYDYYHNNKDISQHIITCLLPYLARKQCVDCNIYLYSNRNYARDWDVHEREYELLGKKAVGGYTLSVFLEEE